jgi:hypothetical protein
MLVTPAQCRIKVISVTQFMLSKLLTNQTAKKDSRIKFQKTGAAMVNL